MFLVPTDPCKLGNVPTFPDISPFVLLRSQDILFAMFHPSSQEHSSRLQKTRYMESSDVEPFGDQSVPEVLNSSFLVLDFFFSLLQSNSLTMGKWLG